MFKIARTSICGFIRGFGRDEAQDVFEYVLIIGIITVAVLLIMATDVGITLVNAVVDGTCAAINTVMTPDVVCP